MFAPHTSLKHWLTAAMGSSALLSVVPAIAQDGASAGGDIIVTAQRRSERLVDVPLSVTALSGDDLARANVASFRDIETVSPGTRVSSTGVFTQPAIRGITSTAIGPGIENNVAFYVDGFYQPDNAALGSDFANVSGVQVLKGPQGTLYGRNALGGAILVSTREPTADKAIEFDAESTYGSRDDVRLRAFLGGRIGEGISLGVLAYYRENDGYLRIPQESFAQPVVNQPTSATTSIPRYITPPTVGRNAAPYQNSEVRLKLKLEPSADFTAVLGYNHIYKFNPAAISYKMYANAYLSGLPVPAFGSPGRPAGIDATANNGPNDFHTRQNEGTMKIVWSLGFGTLSSYTSYTDLQPYFNSDYDGSLVNFLQIASDFDRKTFIENFDFTTSVSDDLTLIVGGLYYDDDSSSRTNSFSLNNLVSQTSSRQKSKAYAVFGEATWETVPGLFLTGGLRYSYEKKRLDGVISGPTAVSANANFDDFTPRATVRYEISPRTNVYASFSQGFKSGFFNSIGQTVLATTTPVKPEEITAYEVGFKTAQGGLRLETAAYYYDYKNLQVSQLLNESCAPGAAGCAPRVGVFVTNAAKAEIYGAEASIHAEPVENLNLRLGVAYTHARYKQFNSTALIVCAPPGGAPRNTDRYIAGCAAVPAGANIGDPVVQDLSGRRIQRAPDWTVSLGGDYTIPVGSGDIVLAGNAFYSSSYAPTSETFDPVTGRSRFYQTGYITGSASITYNLPGEQWWIRGFVDNINDKRFKIVDTASGRGDYRIYSEPRRFGATVGFRY